jgi:molybdopterin synthase sulfur carrier subunit
MVLELLLFGITKDIIGDSPFSFEMNDGNTAAKLLESLIRKYPDLKNLNSMAIAVNGEYAQPTTLIKPGDEIALIPPVSGG